MYICIDKISILRNAEEQNVEGGKFNVKYNNFLPSVPPNLC